MYRIEKETNGIEVPFPPWTPWAPMKSQEKLLGLPLEGFLVLVPIW